jgi:hypothetical protein
MPAAAQSLHANVIRTEVFLFYASRSMFFEEIPLDLLWADCVLVA